MEMMIEKRLVEKAIRDVFVHGYTGDGTVHSSTCRMCKLLKNLDIPLR